MTRRSFTTRHGALIATLALLLSAACDGSSDASPTAPATGTATPLVTASNTPTATPWPTATPEPTPEERYATAAELNALPSDTRLGEPAFDSIVDAVLAGDVEAVLDAIVWEDRDCAVDWSGGPPSPPPCLDGEPAGTPVQSVAVGGGETSYQRPEQVRELLEGVFSEDRVLCDLVRVDDGTRSVVLRQALLWTVVERGTTTEAALVMDFGARVVDGSIVSLGSGGEALLQSSIGCSGIRDAP